MRVFFISVFILLSSFAAKAQYSVEVTIHMYNNYGIPVDVTVVFDSEPSVSFNTTINNSGYSSQYITIPSSGWTEATASFYDCYDSQLTSTFINDPEVPYYSIDFELDYCVDGAINGCTNPNAINYSPIAVWEDGSCEFLNQPENDLCINALLINEGVIWMSNVNAFYELSGFIGCDGYYDLSGSSVWYSFTTPDFPAAVTIQTLADGSESLVNTHLGVFNRFCESEMLFCADGSGDDNFAHLEIGCGQLEEGVTYLLKVSGIDDQMGTCLLSIDFDTTCTDMWGCTNPESYNFEPVATIDDGSCLDPDACLPYLINITGPNNSQGSFQIWRDDSLLTNSSYQGENQNIEVCSPAGCLQLVIDIPPVDGVESTVSTIGPMNIPIYSSPAVGTYDFAAFGCQPTNQYGCTDPLAINYDSIATYSSEICHYLPECGSQLELQAVQISCNEYIVYPTLYYPNITWDSGSGGLLDSGNNYVIVHSENAATIQVCGVAGLDACENTIESCISLSIPGSCFEDCPTGLISSFENSGCTNLLKLNISNADEIEANWNFGDGQSEVATGSVPHMYANSGYYFVCATFIDPTCEENVICDSILVVNCEDQSVFGCTNPSALNFSPDANLDDGSCLYPFDCSFSLYALPDSSEGNVLIIQPSVNLETAQSLLWDFGDGATSNEIFPFHLYQGDGPYILCLTATFVEDTLFCTHSSCIEISASTIDGSGFTSSGFSIQIANGNAPVGIAQSSDLRYVQLWPNPVKNTLNLKFYLKKTQLVHLRILDFSGRTVVEVTLAGRSGENQSVIKLNGISDGLYLIDLTAGDQKLIKKLIVAQ